MKFMSQHNAEIYREFIWLLLAGDIGPTEVAARYSLNKSTVGMWVTNARKRLGGELAARKIANMTLSGEITPSAQVFEDLRPELICKHLRTATANIPKDHNEVDIDHCFSIIMKKLLLNAKGQAERGVFRFVKQDCTGRPIQMQRDLAPEELVGLLEVIERFDELEDLLERRALRRTERVKDLEEREEKVNYFWAQCQNKQDLLGQLFYGLEQKVKSMEIREQKLAKLEELSESLSKKGHLRNPHHES